VPVKIDGEEPYKFVMDAVVAFTCFDQKLVDRLKLHEWQGVRFGVITPTEGSVKLVTVSVFEVGQTKATDLKACTIDLQRMPRRKPNQL
jgi:hypothetical protein